MTYWTKMTTKNYKIEKHEDISDRGYPISFYSNGSVCSYHYDMSWDFIGNESQRIGKRTVVNFDVVPNQYIRGIQDTLFELYNFYRYRDAQTPTSSQLRSWTKGLTKLAANLETTQWEILNNNDGINLLKKNLNNQKYSKKVMQDDVINTLNRLTESRIIKCEFNFKKLANYSVDKKPKQSIAIPIGMYEKILKKSIATIEKYHMHRHDISLVMDDALKIKDRVLGGELFSPKEFKELNSVKISNKASYLNKKIKSICIKKITHNIPDFKIDFTASEMNNILTDCVIVILAFSGVRSGELLSFNARSCEELTINGDKKVVVLRGKTTKSNNGIPKTETWQSHNIAKEALELVEDMTVYLRNRYRKKIEEIYASGMYSNDMYQSSLIQIESAFLLLNTSFLNTRFIASGLENKLNKTIERFNIIATETDVEEFNILNPSRAGDLKLLGLLPKCTPHDLRRTFAVFFKRYGFGSSAGIKFQYKHKNIRMSDYYSNNAILMQMSDVLIDHDLFEIMNEEGINLGVDIYNEIYNQSSVLSGYGGEKITRDKFEKIQSGSSFFYSREELEKMIRSGTISVVQLPTGGYCMNSQCERVCSIGSINTEKKNCIHKVITDKEALKIAKQYDRLVKAFRDFNSGDYLRNSILIALKQKIKTIEITLKQHKISFKLFEDRILGANNHAC
jgi:integrase